MSTMPFKHFVSFIDCSRNAVATVETLKRWIDMIAKMGYNGLALYMEDTYEIEGHPYFGYGRGRYSKAELKELDAYGRANGVEVFPAINTLAHLHTIFRWKHYAEINDCADILLCEDPRTYELIDSMFATCSECFTSRIISVSMDEADLLGKGKYFKLHGYQKPLDILKRHMAKVCEIAEKYGYGMVLIAGDMPFRLATHSDSYSNTKAVVQEDISDLIPQKAALEYWDYYKRDKEDYAALMKIHQDIKKENLWYLGGIWSWCAFSPENYYSTRALRNSIQAALDEGLENVQVCTFGDDGAECARFSVLPAMFYASEIAKGNRDEASIKAKFEEMFGISYDQFLLADLTQRFEAEEYCVHPTRYILYNDPFIGLMDTTIPDCARADHEELVKLLAPLRKHPQWGYLFETLHDLCKVAAAKCDIGIRIRQAYDSADMAELRKLSAELHRIRRLVKKFYASFRRQWMIENKPHGFDVSDIRLGGLMTRLDHCADRLLDYVNGHIDRIEELEEPLLDVRTPSGNNYGEKKYLNYWDRNSRYYTHIATTNIVDNGVC